MWAFIRRKHCLRLQRWQGPPNLNKIVCLFSLSVKIIQRRCSSPYSISSQKQHNALLIFTDDLSKVLHKREQSNTILFLFHLDKWHNSTCSPQPMIHTLFTQTHWLTVSTLQAALQLLFFLTEEKRNVPRRILWNEIYECVNTCRIYVTAVAVKLRWLFNCYVHCGKDNATTR